MRIASHPETRWTNKKLPNGVQASQHWRRSTESSGKTEKEMGRRNHSKSLTTEETQEFKRNDLKNNDTWIWAAKD